MALFKFAIKYEGSSSEETMELEASNSIEARKMCDEMAERNREELERLASRNVYSSKVIKSCRMCRHDHRMDMVGVDEMFRSLEDHV